MQLEVIDASFAYGSAPPAIEHVNLQVEPGEFVAIAGPNGGGKTTLLRMVLGLLRPTAGEVRVFAQPAHRGRGRSRIGYLSQRAISGLEAPVTVREVVASGTTAGGRLLGWAPRDSHRCVDEMIERVGLGDVASRPVRALSGGQRQRALLARVLAGRPEIVALDEPTTGVDVASQAALAELLGGLHRDLGMTILYVSHEFGAVESIARRIVLISGTVVFDGDPHDLPHVWHDPSHVHEHCIEQKLRGCE